MTAAAAHRWHGLLVSVRDGDEAAEAVAGGADIVDVKEPARGPLGAAAAEIAAAVAVVVGRGRPWTLACGELAAGAVAVAAQLRRTIAVLPAGAPPPTAVKAGAAGLALAEWARRFAALCAELPPGVEPVAVAYADWRAARAPDPADLIRAAADAGRATLLLDTFDKAGPGLLDAPLAAAAARCVTLARARGLRVAVAGRIRAAQVPAATRLGADVIAVRSAACGGDRLGRVRRDLVAAVAAAVRHPQPALPSA